MHLNNKSVNNHASTNEADANATSDGNLATSFHIPSRKQNRGNKRREDGKSSPQVRLTKVAGTCIIIQTTGKTTT